MAAIAILLLLSCQKSSRNATKEPTLNITAPSGQPIAASAKQLKEMTASMLSRTNRGIKKRITLFAGQIAAS